MQYDNALFFYSLNSSLTFDKDLFMRKSIHRRKFNFIHSKTLFIQLKIGLSLRQSCVLPLEHHPVSKEARDNNKLKPVN